MHLSDSCAAAMRHCTVEIAMTLTIYAGHDVYRPVIVQYNDDIVNNDVIVTLLSIAACAIPRGAVAEYSANRERRRRHRCRGTSGAAKRPVLLMSETKHAGIRHLRKATLCARRSLQELKRLNSELMRQNEDKDQELERLHKALEDALSTNKLAAAQKKIHALEERLADVRASLDL